METSPFLCYHISHVSQEKNCFVIIQKFIAIVQFNSSRFDPSTMDAFPYRVIKRSTSVKIIFQKRKKKC